MPSTATAADLVSILLEESLGCLMLPIRREEGAYILKWRQDNIVPDDVQETEQNPHVTVVYGFDKNVEADDVLEIASKFLPLTIQLGKVTKFKGDKSDVLKIDVISDRLHELNKALLKEFDGKVTVSFPDYHPHLTLAYVHPGACSDVVNSQFFEGDYFVITDLVYSTPDRVKTNYTVNG